MFYPKKSFDYMFHINYQVLLKINSNIEIWHIYFQHQDLGRIMRHKTPRKSVFNHIFSRKKYQKKNVISLLLI